MSLSNCESPETLFADPLANTLEVKETTVLTAIIQNARALGFNLEDVASCRYDMMSPLYQPARPGDDPAALLSSSLCHAMFGGRSGEKRPPPPDLRPTLNQVLIPHHISLDLIPFPALRDRLIVLSAAMPETFNMWELKLDIYERGGLTVLKGRRGRGSDSEGGYQPWDKRSWVAKPWFLKKWRMIVEDERELMESTVAELE